MFSGRTNTGSAHETAREESINDNNSTSVTRSDDDLLAETSRLREKNATIENGQAFLKSRIRELERKSHSYILERTELKSQLHLMAEKQQAAERKWAAEEEERVQRAVDSRFRSAVETERRQWREEIERVREGAREEMEAERE
jgi:hypothetical protein